MCGVAGASVRVACVCSMLMVRLLDNIVNTVLLIHVFACLWYVVACPLGVCTQGSWAVVEGLSQWLKRTNITHTFCI